MLVDSRGSRRSRAGRWRSSSRAAAGLLGRRRRRRRWEGAAAGEEGRSEGLFGVWMRCERSIFLGGFIIFVSLLGFATRNFNCSKMPSLH